MVIRNWRFLTHSKRSYKYNYVNSDPVNWVSYDSHGKYLGSCSSDLTVKLWDLNSDYQCFKTLFGHNHNVSQIVFTP